MLLGQLCDPLLRLRALLFQGPRSPLRLKTFLALPLQFLPQRTLCPLRQLQAGPEIGVLRYVGLQAREGLSEHVHRSLPNEFRRIFRRPFRSPGSSAEVPLRLPLLLPLIAQSVQTVYGDHVPLVYAFFLLTGYQSTVKYVVADGSCGNTQSFRCNVGVHPSGTSLDTSFALPLVHAGMVAASSGEREADAEGSRGLW